MGPDAVPYLIEQFKRDRSGRTEGFLLWLRQKSITQPFMKNAILPSSKRAYAAVALRRMGGSAELAIPALLEVWKNDIPEVKNDCVAAMAAILYGEHPELPDGVGLSMSKYREFEATVISDAARRFPEIADALQLDSDAKPQIAEPDGAASGSQPIRSETNPTPSAAGSRR
jgi:hypothetical protein